MKKLLAVGALLTLTCTLLHALPEYLEYSDNLSLADKDMEGFALLVEALPSAQTDQERAEIYWRLSMDTLLDADNRHNTGGETTTSLLALYKTGEAYADRAISLDPNNPMGYYLKACNIGRWAQTSPFPMLTSFSRVDLIRTLLVKAAQTDPLVAGPWAILGQLYEQVPGWPLSFGNATWAVSLGRKALNGTTSEFADSAERDIPLDYSTQLARHLAKRGWSSEKRAREQKREAREYYATNDPVKKNFYYEGTVQIPPISDHAEARQLCLLVISHLQGVANLSRRDDTDLKNAQQTLAALGG
jgi:hypothetical protein